MCWRVRPGLRAMNSLVVFCWIGLKLRSRSFVQNIAEPRLTSARECAIVDAMSRARLTRLPLGGRPVALGLVLGRQALEPVDKSAGGGGVRINVGEAAADL